MLATAFGYELDVERGPDWLFVRAHNLNLAESDAPPLAEHLWRLLEQHFTHRLVLELDDAGVLSSSLIGQLVQLRRWIEDRDGVLRLCGLSADNRKALDVCGFDEHLPLYADRHDAVMCGAGPRQPR